MNNLPIERSLCVRILLSLDLLHPSGGDVSDESDYPLRFRVAVIGALTITLIVHIFVDAFNTHYEGAATSLMLGGIVGTAIGVNEYIRGRAGAS